MAVMSIVATAMMAVAMRSFTTTSTITNRRDVLADGRIAIDQMTKQLRQGESVDLTASNAYTLKFSGYIDGTQSTIEWRVTGTSAPYTLEQSRDGGAHFAPLVSPILCKTGRPSMERLSKPTRGSGWPDCKPGFVRHHRTP